MTIKNQIVIYSPQRHSLKNIAIFLCFNSNYRNCKHEINYKFITQACLKLGIFTKIFCATYVAHKNPRTD